MLLRQLYAIAVFSFSSLALASETEQQAYELLNSMTQAMQEKSYHGNFIYLSDGKIENMIFVHRNIDGDISERLYSLNGEAREIIRDNDALTCIWPDSQSVVIDTSVINSQLPAQLPVDLSLLSDNYDFNVMGEERIADLNTVIVSIKPKDSYRYGYQYWIDQDSDLLVRTTVMNEVGKVVEQLMFTQLQISPVEDQLLKPVSKSGTFQKHEIKPHASAAPIKVADSQWRVRMLPNGFNLTMHQRKIKPKVVEHLVFSDGMSSLSVFIEKKSKAPQVLTGYSNMGAVNAFGRYEDNFHITAVGEVPPQTARLIGEALTLQK